MINYDSLTLKAQLTEFQEKLIGGRIQKIQQPTRRDLLFSIRANGENQRFYASIHPDFFHVAIISEEGKEKRGLKIPKNPPMFCMLLRKYLDGAKIVDITQPKHERILEFHFFSHSEMGDQVPMVLAFELMGKHSNIILYNAQNKQILGCAHNIGEEKSKERQLAGGMLYVYPPKRYKIDILKTSEKEFLNMATILDRPLNEWLNYYFENISLALANETLDFLELNPDNNAFSNYELKKLFDLLTNCQSLKSLDCSISSDHKKFSLFSFNKEKTIAQNSTNEMIDNYFGELIYSKSLSSAKSSLNTIMNNEIKKLNNALAKLHSDEELLQKAEKYKQIADTIMANLYTVREITTLLKLKNIYDNNKLEINIETSMSLNDNAQRYYKLYNKSKNTIQAQNSFKTKQTELKNYYETIKTSIKLAQTPVDLAQIKEEMQSLRLIKNQKEEPTKDKKIEIEKFICNDYEIFVGKNNRQNDYIVSKFSRANDIWLHTQEIPGSHVLIKMPNNQEIASNEVLDCASKIAVKFSQAAKSSNVPVIYTSRKFLKKPPGAPLGYVTFCNEKTIIVKN